ncbi:hypothetical protein [Caudoviricetes sp.]|nr:hypothetical protein [Caudoviricetes sp.]
MKVLFAKLMLKIIGTTPPPKQPKPEDPVLNYLGEPIKIRYK